MRTGSPQPERGRTLSAAMTRPHASVTILLLLLLALFWLVPSFPLTVFVAVLLAVALRALAEPLIRRLGLPEALGVLAVLLCLGALAALGIHLALDPLSAQARQLADSLPGSLGELERHLHAEGWGRWLLDHLDGGLMGDLETRDVLQRGGQAASFMGGLLGGLFGGLGTSLFTLLLALYFALHPETYLRGLRALLAPELQEEAKALLSQLGTVLRFWLAGQLFSMAFTGTLVWLGLWFLGIPLAAILGVLTALLGFIPIVGPILAAVPAVLMGASQGFDTALWVVALFLVLHVLEGDILTPLIQSRAVDLPPGMLLMSQLFLGALFGLLGLAVAAPLAAVTITVVKRSYVRDWLRRLR